MPRRGSGRKRRSKKVGRPRGGKHSPKIRKLWREASKTYYEKKRKKK